MKIEYLDKAIFVRETNTKIGTSTRYFVWYHVTFQILPKLKISLKWSHIRNRGTTMQRMLSEEDFSNISRHDGDTE
jgi:hypothetical protein